MAQNIRVNDWMVAQLTKPEATLMDFYSHNVRPENTQILDADTYKHNNTIRNHFIDATTGKFNEEKFNEFYDNALKSYNYYASDEFDKNINDFITDTALVAPEDIFYDGGNRNVNPTIDLNSLYHDRDTVHGITGDLSKSFEYSGTKSVREIAQNQKVHDGKTGEELDWTPEDKGGFIKGIFRPTIALATWKEDGEHVVNGRLLKHKKGDLKFNENGNPYAETIPEGESFYGRDIIHYSDTLTREDSPLNKIDFFDSDGKEKSMFGSVMKMAFTIAPYIVSRGKTRKWIGGLGALWETSKVFPQFTKGLVDIANGDRDTGFEKAMEQWDKLNTRFQRSQSDKGRGKFFSVEGITGMISDVFPQLAQQRTVALIPKLIGGNSPTTQKIGSQMAMTYMALTSSTDSYQQFKEAGASDRVAGLGMLATAAAMYGLQNVNYFHETLTKGTWLDPELNRKPIRAMADSMKKYVVEAGENPSQTKAKSFFRNVYNEVKNKFKAKKEDFHSFKNTGFNAYMRAGINEGTEEVMEEISADMVKGITEALESLGVVKEDIDFNWSARDMFQRYATAFIGGAVGGMIFNWQNNRDLSQAHINYEDRATHNWEWQDEIAYMLRQGKRKDIDKYVNKLRKKGLLGDVNLSASKYKTIGSVVDGNQVYYESPTSDTDNQNEAVYNAIQKYLNHLEEIISTEGLGLTDRMILRYLEDPEYYKGLNKNEAIVELMRGIGVQSNILSDMDDLSNRIIKKRQELEAAIKASQQDKDTSTDSEKKDATETTSREDNIKRLKKELNELRKEKDEITSGKRNPEYLGQAVFAMHSSISGPWSGLSKEQYARAYYNEIYSTLEEGSEKKKKIDEEYDKWIKDKKKQLFTGLDSYKSLAKEFKADLEKKQLKHNPIYDEMTNLTYEVSLQEELKQINEKLKTVQDRSQEKADLLKRQKDIIKQISAIGDNYGYRLLLKFNDGQGFNRIIMPGNLVAVSEAFRTYGENIKKLIADNKAHNYSHNNNEEYNYYLDQIRRNYNTKMPLNILLSLVATEFYKDKDDRTISLLKKFFTANTSSDVVTNELYQLKEGDKFKPVVDINAWLSNGNPFSTEQQAIINDHKQLKKLIELFNDIYINHKYVNKQAINAAIDELVNDFKKDSFVINANDVTELFNVIASQLGIENVNDILDMIDDVSKVDENTYRNLLKKMLINLGKETATARIVLDTERSKLNSLQDQAEYIMENANAKKELDELSDYIRYFNLMINGSYDGFNKFLNDYKISEAPVIDEATAKELINQSLRLQQEIKTLKLLSDQNENQRLKIQKDVDINMLPKFMLSLFNGSVPDDIKAEFDIDIRTLRDQAFEGSGISFTAGDVYDTDIDEQNYDKFQKAYYTFHKLLSEEFAKKNLPQIEFAHKWYKAWKSREDKLKSRLVTSLTTDKDEVVEDFDSFLYWSSIISTPFDTWNSKYQEAIKAIGKTPSGGQEMALRMLVANFLNRQFFSELHKRIPIFVPKDPTLDQDVIDWQENKYRCERILFVLGGAGTGNL